MRILVIDRGMDAERAGALVQRVIEIETYRTLALLGLPEAQRLAPSIAASERRLVEATEEKRRAGDLASNHRLLDELTALAAEVEAASVFRFGASRAYGPMERSSSKDCRPSASVRSRGCRPGPRFWRGG